MRRQVCDQIEAKLAAKGLAVQRAFDGGKGYTLKVNGQTVATKTAGEKMLRKGAPRGASK